MNQCHAVASVAACADRRLGDAATVNLYPGRVSTHLALEKGLLHLGDQLGRPDDHAIDGDELVNVWGKRQVSLPQGYSPAMCRLLYQQISPEAQGCLGSRQALLWAWPVQWAPLLNCDSPARLQLGLLSSGYLSPLSSAYQKLVACVSAPVASH